MTCLCVGLAVEGQTGVAAHREGRVCLDHLANRQVQVVIDIVAVRLFDGFVVVAALAGYDRVPLKRYLVRTNSQ